MEFLNSLPSCSHQKLSLSIQKHLKMNKLWYRKPNNLLQVGNIIGPLNLGFADFKGSEKFSWTPWIVETALPLRTTQVNAINNRCLPMEYALTSQSFSRAGETKHYKYYNFSLLVFLSEQAQLYIQNPDSRQQCNTLCQWRRIQRFLQNSVAKIQMDSCRMPQTSVPEISFKL